MTVSALTPISVVPAGPASVHAAIHPLPADNLGDFARDIVVYTMPPARMGALLARAENDLPGLAALPVVHRVMAHNPDTVWAIGRCNGHDERPDAEGFVGFLMLNLRGVRRLLAGSFDASDPDPTLLCRQNERPAGIYLWAMWARNGLVAGVPPRF